MSLYSDAVQSFLQSNLIVGADVLTYKTARIAVRNRRIVKICMDIFPEYVLCVIFPADNRCPGKCNLHGIHITLNQIL